MAHPYFHKLHARSFPRTGPNPQHQEFESPEHLSAYLKRGKYALLTPYRAQDDAATNAANYQKFKQDLQSAGHRWTPLMGQWGGQHEPSFMVHGISREQATELGRKYNQQAVIHAEEGTHSLIPTHPSTEHHDEQTGTEHEIAPHFDDDFSLTHTNSGPARFRLHFGATKKSEPITKALTKAEAPKGFISPEGKFHEVPKGVHHHEWIHDYTKAHHPELHEQSPEHDPYKYSDDSYGKALGAGWISVGVGRDHGSDGHNLQADSSIISNPLHPATAAARQIARQHWGDSFEVMARSPEGYKVTRADTKPFVSAGRFKASLGKSEPLSKKASVRDVANGYLRSAGIAPQPAQKLSVDPNRGARIAQAYHEMPHRPNDPKVKAAYGALINETKKQFQHIKNSGLKISRMKPGQPNPYPNGSKDVHRDVNENRHLWYYPTEMGFGSSNNRSDHPMLAPTGEEHEGKPLLANDMFRIVHDYFGHAKEGHGFGHTGEENAWNEHRQMYSPLAQQALATETRGQNSWVNFGPHGEKNRKDPANTVYADQKAGLLPDWVHNDVTPMKKSEKLDKGSWQSKHPVKQSKVDSKAAQDWIANFADTRANIPRSEGGIRTRSLARLAAAASVRKNPKTGEHEFLLHRGHGPKDPVMLKRSTQRVGWTPSLDVAQAFGEYGPHRHGTGIVTSAWIPASKVVSVLKHIVQPNDLRERLRREHEVIVEPHDYQVHSQKFAHQVGKKIVKTESLKKTAPARLVHYSPTQGLKQIDPKHQGKGVRSEEYKRGLPEVPRSYFYREGTKPEDLVTGAARSKYFVSLKPEHKIYDLANDHAGLIEQTVRENQGVWNSDKILGKIREAGYHGFSNSGSNLPNVVALFHPSEVESEEPIHKGALDQGAIADVANRASMAMGHDVQPGTKTKKFKVRHLFKGQNGD